MSLPLESASQPVDRESSMPDPAITQPDGPDVRASGSVDDFTSFCETVAPAAKRFAMSLVHRWCEAEELVQEAFFRMTRAEHGDRPAFDKPGASRKAYLFMTIRNLAIDDSRKRQRRPMEPADLDQVAAKPVVREDLGSIEAAINQVFSQMPDSWSHALKLKVNAELSYQEIAEVLEATHAQIRGWIFRARKLLANELQRQGYEVPVHES